TPSSALSLFSPSDTPSVADASDSSAAELGVKFTSATSGQITGIRFYKGPTNTGTHVGDLWSASGTLLASATFTDETASGWQQVNFSTPVNITAGATYIASYHTDTGNYADTPYFFATYQGQSNGSLNAPGDSLNGVYAYGAATSFPGTTSGTADNYWVDVVFKDTGGSITQTPPVANNDSGFTTPENMTLSIAAASLLANDSDPDGDQLTITGVSNPTNGTVSYDASAQKVSFVPQAGYMGPASFTYSISDGHGGTASANVALTVTAPSTVITLFGNNAPTNVTDPDPNAVELGVKFTASEPGTITGIRFYKGPENTGTHIGDLWNSTGQLLATATFSNETASGWQDVQFSSPVAVTAGTTYIASYHTDAGYYSEDDNYFANAYTSGPLTAPDSASSGGNGVYAYSNSTAFPNNTYNAANYWVDVDFQPSSSSQGTNTPPVANNDSGFTTPQNTTLTIAAASLLANDSDPDGDTLSITGVTGATDGTVSYNATTQQVTFVPTNAYTGPASFIYSISDGHGGTASATVSLNVTPPSTGGSTVTLFGNSTPTNVSDPDSAPVELGVKFTASESGTIKGIRFYKGAQNTGTHIGDLWNSTGQLLATATFSNETASGWQDVQFSSPVPVTAGTTYIASYHTDAGYYSEDDNYFANAYTSGPLTAPDSASSGGNGVYAYSTSTAFPDNTYDAANYWVDVDFQPSGSSQGTNTPPVANNDSGFTTPENTTLTIAAASLLANDSDPDGDTLTITGVSGASDGTVSYNANTQQVTFVPDSGYTGPASFIYSISDGHGGTASADASLNVTPPSTVGSTDTLFGNSTPTNASDPDSQAVELGVKFTSSQAGTVTGIRFYKSAQNTGTHIGDLWSSTGQLLATGTFSNETASGWQELDFASPVSITPGTTYIASYHTNVGHYSGDNNYFAAAHTSGPLTAPSSSSSGGNGVYAYNASSAFPTDTYNASNYWVDVVFRPS
ncbi:MAG: DUF4082 domain-containing protein, partial [Acetobacteraceae bacterium]|nr:DUF4082 domain-containing protein [Acetobacteraceae bacterium]